MTDDDIDRLVSKLDLEQKARLVTGASVWRTGAEPDIGLRAMVFSDGPAGVRGEGWDERDNIGERPGREVVQVYLARPETSLARPPRWLAGHAMAEARPGESVEVDVRLPARAFQHWDAGQGAWHTEPGGFTVLAGRSSADLPLSAAVFG